jgi:hypothetical protein
MDRVTISPCPRLGKERWERLGAANAKANLEHLRALTIESALRKFEQLVRDAEKAFPEPRPRKTHPVGLGKIWKSP